MISPNEFLLSTEEHLELQRVVLCGMLRKFDLIPEVMNILEANDFSGELGGVFQAIIDIWQQTRVSPYIDAELVIDIVLPASGKGREEWRLLFVMILESDPVCGSCISAAQRVLERSVRKQMLRVALDLQQEAIDPSCAADEAIAHATSEIMNIKAVKEQQKTVPLSSAVHELFDKVDSGVCRGVLGHLVDLDELTGGFHGGELSIIAARPSVGKTALALTMALNMANNGVPVLFFSLEQSRTELAGRAICWEGRSNLPSNILRSRERMNPLSAQRFLEAGNRVAQLPFLINDSASMKVRNIWAIARRHKLRGEVGMIFVDYLQLIEPDDTRQNANRAEQVAAMSGGLKKLARDLDVPVMALAQLNRNAEDRRPRLSDLRESGGIEQDADTVLLLHRAGDPDRKAGTEIQVIIAKQRNGPVGDVDLCFVKQSMRFENAAVVPEIPE